MAAPSLTYTLTNGATADASQVMQNFNDLLNGITDGTKDLSISALTCAGTATLNGHVNLGNASGDDLTITASLASSLPIKTNTSFDIGSATLGLRAAYLGGTSTFTGKVLSATLAASRVWTIPDTGADASFVMTAGAQTIGGAKTFSAVMLGAAAGTGVEATPSFAFSGDPDTGFWNLGANQLACSTGGTQRFYIDSSGFVSTVRLYAADGSVTSPGISLTSDPDTGFYSLAGNSLGITTAGVRCGDITSGAWTIGLSTDLAKNHLLYGNLDSRIGSSFNNVLTSTTSGVQTMIRFQDGTPTTQGSITCDTTANTTAYATSSDARLKTNVKTLSTADQILASVDAREYERYSNPGIAEIGFIAQELETVFAQAVVTDPVDGMKSVDYGKVTPILWQAVKDLVARVTALEAS